MVVFALVIKFGTGGFLWSSDAESYFTLAKNLLSNGSFFIRQEWGFSAFRTPLYPIFVAAFYWVIPELWFVILIQNILGAFSVVLVYKLAKYTFGNNVALLSSVLFLIESQRLHVANQLMSETLFIMFFLPAFYFFFKYKSDKKLFNICLSGIFLGLSALTRPVAQFVPVIMSVFILAARPAKKEWKKNIFAAMILITTFGMTVSPWLIRNKIRFDVLKLSPLGGTNLYFVNAAHYLQYLAKAAGQEKEFYSEFTDKAFRDLNINLDRSNWTEQSIRLMEFDYEAYFSREALKIILSNPLSYARVHASRMIPFLIDSSLSRSSSAVSFNMPYRPNWLFYPYLYWGGRIIRIVLFTIILAVMIINWQAVKKRLWAWTFFTVIILYFGALAAMNWDAPRMRLPVNPLIFMMFGEAAFILVRKFILEKQKPI